MVKTKKKAENPIVGIVMGSDSDYTIMEESVKILDHFSIAHEVLVASAHRSPDLAKKYIRDAEKRGIKVLIAGAGGAAHLAGVMAAECILPVIGVPVASSSLQGFDSLLSTVQMPSGIPVATMAVGKAGAKNAGVLAAQIIALNDKKLAEKLHHFKKYLAKEVEIKSKKLQAHHGRNH